MYEIHNICIWNDIYNIYKYTMALSFTNSVTLRNNKFCELVTSRWACWSVTSIFVIIYKLIQHYSHKMIEKISYTVKLHSNMIWLVATTKSCWNEVWLYKKSFETFYEHSVWSILDSNFIDTDSTRSIIKSIFVVHSEDDFSMDICTVWLRGILHYLPRTLTSGVVYYKYNYGY